MDVPVLVDVSVTGRAIAGGTVGAREEANVEDATAETVGMIF